MDPSGGDWDRWRGGADARLDDVEYSMRDLWAWKAAHEAEAAQKYAALLQRLTSVETKLIFFAAMAAGLGAMFPQLLAAVVKHL